MRKSAPAHARAAAATGARTANAGAPSASGTPGAVASATLKGSLLARIGLREVLIALLGGLLMGLPLALGHNYSFTDFTLQLGRRLVVELVAFVLVIAVFSFFALRFFGWLADRGATGEKAASGKGLAPARWPWLTPRVIGIVVFVACLACWTPAFMALYPGYYASDGPIQVYDLLVRGVFDQHQPLFHTLILTGLLSLGNALFGSYNAGLTLYCVVQAMVVAGALGFSCAKAAKWGAPRLLAPVAAVLTALNPVVQAWTFGTTKDILFGAMLLLVLVFAVDLLLSAKAGEKPAVRTVVAEILCIIALCLLRKQGVYVIVVVAVIWLVAYRRSWKTVLVALALPAVAAMAINSGLATATNAVPDSVREMMSVPSQQIARVYVLERDTLSQQDLADIERFYDLDGLKDYIPIVADPAKGALRDDALKSDLGGYLGLWAHLGVSHPGTYVNSFLIGVLGYVYPNGIIANRWAGLAPWNEFSLPNCPDPDNQITQQSMLPDYYQQLQIDNWFFFDGKGPLLELYAAPALPYFVMVAALLWLLYRRRYGAILPLMFVALFWCSLLLGPVMNSRYSYPLSLCVPAILAWAWSAGARPTGR